MAAISNLHLAVSCCRHCPLLPRIVIMPDTRHTQNGGTECRSNSSMYAGNRGIRQNTFDPANPSQHHPEQCPCGCRKPQTRRSTESRAPTEGVLLPARRLFTQHADRHHHHRSSSYHAFGNLPAWEDTGNKTICARGRAVLLSVTQQASKTW